MLNAEMSECLYAGCYDLRIYFYLLVKKALDGRKSLENVDDENDILFFVALVTCDCREEMVVQVLGLAAITKRSIKTK